jgi:hypothetical protein
MIPFIGQVISTSKGGAVMVMAYLGGSACTLGATIIGDETGVAISVMGGLLVAVFYAGRALQKINDQQRSTDARLSRIENILKIGESEERKHDENT